MIKKCIYWFYLLGSPKWYLTYGKALLNWGSLTVALVLFGWYWGLFIAPADYQQGEVYRIMYLHVPVAFLSQAAYIFMALALCVFWIWKIHVARYAALAFLHFGMVATLLAIFTGSLWGKPTWGAYWVWDARLTSLLILLLFYCAILLLQYTARNQMTSQQTLCYFVHCWGDKYSHN